MKQRTSHLLACYDAPKPVLTRGQGVWLWDDDTEKDYIDLAGGVAVNALGHCHPALVKVITEQANKLWHLSNWWLNQPALDLAKKICELSFGEQVFFVQFGSRSQRSSS